MSDSPRSARPGTLASMLNGVVSLLFTRAELMRIEWQEQQERLLQQITLIALAVLLLLAALIAGLLFVVLLTPQEWRIAVTGTLALLLAAGSLLLLWQVRRRAARAPAAFACTLDELRKDWQALSGKDLS